MAASVWAPDTPLSGGMNRGQRRLDVLVLAEDGQPSDAFSG
jgi:hypothetical protein